MTTLCRKFLICSLLGLFLLTGGCGSGHQDPENPGQGEDAPVMDQVPDPPEPN